MHLAPWQRVLFKDVIIDLLLPGIMLHEFSFSMHHPELISDDSQHTFALERAYQFHVDVEFLDAITLIL
jgi:hypothetical protein